MKKKVIISCISALLAAFCLTGCNPMLDPIIDAYSSHKDGIGDGDSLMLEGIEAYEAGDYGEALRLLASAEVLGLEEESLCTLYSYLASCYEETEAYDIAIKYNQMALEEDPSDVQNYVNLAISYRLSGDYEKAMETYTEGAKIDPDYPELNSSIGTLCLLMEDPYTAIEYFEKALAVNPNLNVTYGNATLAYAMTGDFDTAEEYLEIARELDYDGADKIEELIDSLR